jgi:hypothetical protein
MSYRWNLAHFASSFHIIAQCAPHHSLLIELLCSSSPYGIPSRVRQMHWSMSSPVAGHEHDAQLQTRPLALTAVAYLIWCPKLSLQPTDLCVFDNSDFKTQTEAATTTKHSKPSPFRNPEVPFPNKLFSHDVRSCAHYISTFGINLYGGRFRTFVELADWFQWETLGKTAQSETKIYAVGDWLILYLTKLIQPQESSEMRRQSWKKMINWKKMVVAYFKVLSRQFIGKTEENHEKDL